MMLGELRMFGLVSQLMGSAGRERFKSTSGSSKFLH
jgi:hypothetical protein